MSVVARYLSQPLRSRRDYGGKESQKDEFPQQPYSNMSCPSCGHETRFKEGQEMTCPVCSSIMAPGGIKTAVSTREKPYTHHDLLRDFHNEMQKGNIKGNPADLDPVNKGSIKGGQGLFETLNDVQERVVPRIEKYIEFYSNAQPSAKDEPLSPDFKKQLGFAAKSYSEFFSRLSEINDLLHRSVKLAQEGTGGKDHSIISTLEEIAETGAKQGFKKLKSLGFSQWAKDFLNRVRHIQKAVEGLSFK